MTKRKHLWSLYLTWDERESDDWDGFGDSIVFNGRDWETSAHTNTRYQFKRMPTSHQRTEYGYQLSNPLELSAYCGVDSQDVTKILDDVTCLLCWKKVGKLLPTVRSEIIRASPIMLIARDSFFESQGPSNQKWNLSLIESCINVLRQERDEKECADIVTQWLWYTGRFDLLVQAKGDSDSVKRWGELLNE